ncbi:ABC transporter ATP-binding protein [Opitutales bacterium ASA1]|uniref:ABC transporter ATP-binding protein n=1 Tax=Congregicoccus parvus TaxID=3081749 RepID=UPI002B31BF60|nr:ABC transporter ATP-binding protein [Opitutales bacterium ASA1]
MSHEPQEDQFHSRIDWRLWRQVLAHARPHKRLVRPLAVAAVVVALVDGSFALVTRGAIDTVLEQGTASSIGGYIAAYVALALALSVGVWVFIKMAGGVSNHVSHDIRRAGFARLQELEFAYFDHRPVGWLISRLTSDCDKLARIIAWGILDCLWAICLVVVIAVVLLVMDWRLALVTLTVVPPLLVISAWFQKRMLLSARETRKYNSIITASFTEALAGMRTTKTLVREKENLSEFSRLADSMFDVSLLNARQSALYVPVVLTLGSIASGLALWYGGASVMADRVSLGTLIAFLFYAGQFFHPIHQIAHVMVQMQGAQAAGERVLGLLATEPKIKDSLVVEQRIRARAAASTPDDGLAADGYPRTIRTIEFRDVGFSYDGAAKVLEGFNLEVHAGQMVALVGPSGGGKTTIVNLASRFYEPTAGRILLDGVDYRERSLSWLQSNLGIVLQQPHLFAGSVRENIRYGRLEATDAEVEHAARLVNAHDFISGLEKGYDTDVGEGGSRLSTGQKQLVSFARAILADPQIFVMDEATSSIDTETEQLIQKALRSVFAGRISFVIAHRLSTIRSADLILVIQKGRIEEAGTHAELMRRRGHYHDLYTNQFRGERERAALEEQAAIASSSS